MAVIIEAINDEYEYIQYNEQLRLIHSIIDDMFYMKSIIDSCHSNKESRKWFENQSTKEILDELRKIYEKRENIPNELKGY